ncbi:MAG TPA: hypothetical protein VGM60_15435 [Pseudonocardia sp.]|uniref:hypothetical protein n=1 Tax=Pseudonocardia sp. TaxID=60912 RepID=UPI002F41BE9D
MTGPVGAPAPAATADLASLRTQVTPENVLLLHNGLKAEAQYLRGQMRACGFPVQIGEPGLDPVSKPAAVAFNAKIQTLNEQLEAYIALLKTMAEAMAQTAKSYGHNEDELTASFTSYFPGYEANAIAPQRISHTRGTGLVGGPR